jgi:ParB family chromosome partitioning protein
VVKAYGAGKVKLEKPATKHAVRVAPSFLEQAGENDGTSAAVYNALVVSKYLGWTWTNNDRGGEKVASRRVLTSLAALELIEQGALKRTQFRGLRGVQARGFVSLTRENIEDKTKREVARVEKTPSAETKAALAKASQAAGRACGVAFTEARKDAESIADALRTTRKKLRLPGTKKTNYGNNENDQWYTPERFIKAARAAMGSIDLDPASSEAANAVVKATRFFSIEDDGLQKKWEGNVWINPPYSQPALTDFVEKLKKEVESGRVTQACVLVNNASDVKWHVVLSKLASAHCAVACRVSFWKEQEGDGAGSPVQGSDVLYIGNRVKDFATVFQSHGTIWRKA